MKEYIDFIKNKSFSPVLTGIESAVHLNPSLFDFQSGIVEWGLKRGRAAIWADCGLGKTPMQLEWAHQVNEVAGQNVLIFAPLAVAQQTVREGKKFGIELHYARHQSEFRPGITITNYEMLEHFDPTAFGAVVLDESSILKSYTGKFRNQIIETFQQTPFRLACTATPAPNDYMELGNHAEFLGVMSRTEMLATFFIHDGGETSKWRLKGHAEEPFWKWLASIAVMIRKPSDLGFDDKGFKLPGLKIHQHILPSEKATDGFLFAMPGETLSEQRAIKRGSIAERVEMVREIVSGMTEPCVVWCELNDESRELAQALGTVELCGADEIEDKERKLIDFTEGRIKVLVTKPSIAGYGLNWQHCPNMVFASLSHSYEDFYQCVRRCWRFGQKKPVQVHQVLMDSETHILENLQRKQREADEMVEQMVIHMAETMKSNMRGLVRRCDPYNPNLKIRLPHFIGA